MELRSWVTWVACILVTVSAPSAAHAGPQKEKVHTAVSIPRFKSTWFDRLEAGLRKAAVETGVNVIQVVPSTADPAQQVKLIEDATNQGSDALLIVPDDPPAVEPALAAAQKKNIVTITHQSPYQPHADYDVEMIDNSLFGALAMEEMERSMTSTSGEYAVFVGSFTSADHNLWADAAVALARQKYPGLRLVGERFPVSEDQGLSRQTALNLLAAYPDLGAFIVFGSQGGPGVAQALRQRGLVGTVAVVSTTGPAQASPFIKDGSLSASVVWDPAEAGYAMLYLAWLALEGKTSAIGVQLDIPGLGRPLSFSGNTLVYNRPIVITKDNVDEFSGF